MVTRFWGDFPLFEIDASVLDIDDVVDRMINLGQQTSGRKSKNN
jgi:hypothetical protein